MAEGLAGETALQTGLESRRCAAVLRASLEGQERTEKSENRGSLCEAPPEAQCRHGEQDHPAAAQSKRAGTIDCTIHHLILLFGVAGLLWNPP